MRRHRLVSGLMSGLVYGLMLLPLAGAGQPAYADRPAWLAQSPQLVGEARFRLFIFDIYDVALVSPDGGYDGTPPYALKLSYLRDVERQAIVESSLDEMPQGQIVYGSERTRDSSVVCEHDKLHSVIGQPFWPYNALRHWLLVRVL